MPIKSFSYAPLIKPKKKIIGIDTGRRGLVIGAAATAALYALEAKAQTAGALAGVPTNDSYAAPNFRRLAGAASTPENNGLTVDRTGSVDSTTALNTWINNLVANGDRGELGDGTFKTSGALVASGGTSLRLSGNGPQATLINSTSSAYPLVHINLTNGTQPTGYIKGIGVQGPSANPTTQQAGFLVDATTLFKLEDLDTHNCDIGYDFIINCYNCVGYNLNASRFYSCNVGINLRGGGSGSGSDMSFFNSILVTSLFAVCIGGGGGGFHFFGGQWGCGQNGTSAPVDANGVIQLGWNYTSGSTATGVDGIVFQGIGLEGWQNSHGIRIYGETQAKFDTCSFNATQATSTLQAIDVCKGTGLNNSIITFDSCIVGGIYSAAFLGSAAGSFISAPFRQTNWYVPAAGGTANGVSFGNSPTFDITTQP